MAIDLLLLDGEYAVTLLETDAAMPDWLRGPGFVNVSLCDDELAVVTRADRVPAGLKSDGGWRAIKFAGTFGFDQAGVLLSVIRPVSEAGFGVFVASTFYRDYLLLRADGLERCRELLTAAGHRWLEEGQSADR